MTTADSVNYRDILSLAVPSIIANVTTPLLSLADTAIAGHLGSAVFLAAIAVGGSMFNMIYYLFNFLRMGTGGRTAQAFGAGNVREANRILGRSLFTSVVISAVIMLFHPLICRMGIGILDPDPDTAEKAVEYFGILIYGCPAVMMNYSFIGWLIGMQRSKDTMMISFVINIVNISLSFTLVYFAGMGIAGIALGTLAAQWTGAAYGFILSRRNGFRLPPKKGFFAPLGEESENRNVNINLFLRTLCLTAVTIWFTRTGAGQGAVMLAVNSLLMQFFIIFSYFMDGFAFAGEALVGKFHGAGNETSMRRTVKMLMTIGIVMALIFTVLYAVTGEAALRLLSDDPAVRAASEEYTLWILALPAAGFGAFIMDGVFVGLTRSRTMFYSLLVAAAVFFAALAIFRPLLGNHGLWLSFILYLLARGVALLVMFRRFSGSSGKRE